MKHDLVGKKFNRLTVLSKDIRERKKRTYWNVICDCGVEKSVRGENLVNGQLKSCGCFHREVQATRHIKHNMSHSTEYTIWENMIARCGKSTHKAYKNYGARGIVVSDEWKDFANFFEDMGKRPSLKHTLDRIDNSKNYCKENCRWATWNEQARNKRTNNNITFKGKTMCITDWAKTLNLTPASLYKRLKKWDFEKAMTLQSLIQ
jgi:CDGSH-type Zn-finger protein